MSKKTIEEKKSDLYAQALKRINKPKGVSVYDAVIERVHSASFKHGNYETIIRDFSSSESESESQSESHLSSSSSVLSSEIGKDIKDLEIESEYLAEQVDNIWEAITSINLTLTSGGFVLSSGVITSGLIGIGAVNSGNISSGAIDMIAGPGIGITISDANSFTFTNLSGAGGGGGSTSQLTNSFIANDYISGSLAVMFSSSGTITTYNPAASNVCAIGIAESNTLSGQMAPVIYYGEYTSTIFNFSGYVGQKLWAASGGNISVFPSPLSGNAQQGIGSVASKSGIFINIEDRIVVAN
jgi:hypothetical protein